MSEPDTDDIPAELQEMANVLDVRELVLDVLLEKIDKDRYPSASMMDDVEQLLTPWRRREYAEILIAKIKADRFPSRSLIQRLVKLSNS